MIVCVAAMLCPVLSTLSGITGTVMDNIPHDIQVSIVSHLNVDDQNSWALSCKAMSQSFTAAVLQNFRSTGHQIRCAFRHAWVRQSNQSDPYHLMNLDNLNQTRYVIAELFHPQDPIDPHQIEFLLNLCHRHGKSVIGRIVWRQLHRHRSRLTGAHFNALPVDIRRQTIDAIAALNATATLSSRHRYSKRDIASIAPLLLDHISLPDTRHQFKHNGMIFTSIDEGLCSDIGILLLIGVDDIQDGSVHPPLHVACMKRDVDMVRMMIDLADSRPQLVQVRSEDRRNALHALGYNPTPMEVESYLTIAKLILDSSVNPAQMIMAEANLRDGGSKYTLLQLIIVNSDQSNITAFYLETLQRAQYDIFVDATYGRHLVLKAIWHRRIEHLKVILDYAPNVCALLRVKDCFGETAIQSAIYHERRYGDLPSRRVRELIESRCPSPSWTSWSVMMIRSLFCFVALDVPQ